MYAHERSLVKRLADKPFALIGVNSDTDPDLLKARIKAEAITWRSFWCGQGGAWGRIPSQWGIGSWPTVYVLDHKGLIRFEGVKGDKLNAAVEQLLDEMDSDKKRAPGK
ncbi:MAG: hypothetical protein CMJ85_03320 [Planctomycetes bacterium]|jgi:hypothetical protein|nr:hypothetical protein [Planctomycetota bacterium]